MHALLTLLLLGAAPIHGARTFSVTRGPGELRLVQHRDGGLVLQASDGRYAVTCAPSDWGNYRAFFAAIAGSWFTKPAQDFGSVDKDAAKHGAEPAACDVSAFSRDYHVYVEVARLQGAARTDYVRVEVSPIQVSHTVVDVSVVQRAEDNAFGVQLAEIAATLTLESAVTVLPMLDASGGVEDTRTYNVNVIEADTDLSLLVLVLDAYRSGGALPENADIESAYRIRKVVQDTSPSFFFRVLSRLAQGHPASEILTTLRACGEDVAPGACLERAP